MNWGAKAAKKAMVFGWNEPSARLLRKAPRAEIGGLVVRESDVADLRDGFARLMADPGLGQELGRRGRARVLAEYTQARIAARTVEVYREVLGQSGRSGHGGPGEEARVAP